MVRHFRVFLDPKPPKGLGGNMTLPVFTSVTIRTFSNTTTIIVPTTSLPIIIDILEEISWILMYKVNLIGIAGEGESKAEMGITRNTKKWKTSFSNSQILPPSGRE